MTLPPLPPAQDVPVAKVQLNPDNLRQTYELEALMESIRTVGLLQPPGVWRDAQRDCYHVIWGNQRTACLKRLEAPTMQARVFPGPLPPGMGDKYQIIENVLRVDLKPSEEARGYRRILDQEGVSATDLAAMISVANSTITKKLALLRLRPDLLARVDSGEVPETAGYALAALDEAEQAAIALTLPGHVSRDDVIAAVRKRQGKPSKPKARKHALRRGRLGLTFSGNTLAELLDELEELIKLVRKARDKGQDDLKALARSLRLPA